ncbi:type I methionyl aminopeptidase [Rheinheimera aquimaris]|jgi:methionyl aminopeptidase|uniref:Methionine aminopeptidase n=1 Tax=Rheinheimera aquimaris TaxID=412437 RepID=A0ABP3P4J4_9GAMM|nr:type I methionyl aminopeptidase [Rheinheimera aquimaris]MCB5214381.1 type I methionyl aminopeptidase [Rheinheimera aquimaris]
MTPVVLKTPDEISLQREAGRLLAQVFAMLDGKIAEGISTLQINDLAERYIVDELHARPASKGQYGFAYVLNTSVNDVVCHGVPSAVQLLRSGDIINVDITLEKHGFIADSSKMYCIGSVKPDAKALVYDCYQALWLGINAVKPGGRLGDIGFAIEQFARRKGYSVVREYCGHGIGREMHEAPQVLHYGTAGSGMILKPGMVFTIEPMLNQGSHKVKTKKDGWTVVTRDKKLSAQWEHTVAVTTTGFEVLTLRSEEQALFNE